MNFVLHTTLSAAMLSGAATAATPDAPPVTDGLVLWLDAGSLDAADGDKLEYWPSQGLSTAQAKAGAADAQPTFVADAGAGFAAIRFDGKSASEGGDLLVTDQTPEQEATVFAVFRRGTQTDAGSINRPIVSSGTIGRGGNQLGLGLTVDREPSSNRVRVEAADAPSSQDYGINDGNFHIAAATFIGLDTNQPKIQLNLGGIALPEMIGSTAANPGSWTIGGGEDASLRADADNFRYFAGELAAVLIYDRALPAAELDSVGRWLSLSHNLGRPGWWSAGDAKSSSNKVSKPQDEPAFTVADGLFDLDDLPTLGLPTVLAEHIMIYAPSESSGEKFNHQVKLYDFDGHLYAHWQAAARDEDAADSHVVYSRSSDGRAWSAPQELAPPAEGKYIRSSGGWWSDGQTLTAFINYPSKPKLGRVTETRTSRDGQTWSPIEDSIRGGSLVGNPTQIDTSAGKKLIGIFLGNSPVDRKNGTLIKTTDDLTGRSGWSQVDFTRAPTNRTRSARGVEPALFKQADGDLVVVFRDMHVSGRSLASISKDEGQTWSVPTVTDMPDSGSMQCAGNLPDGTAYLVNVPAPATDLRVPLAVTLSKDGENFDCAFAIRTEVPEVWFEGKEKLQGYSYPHAWVWDDALWVAYATCKERVEVSRIALKDLLAD
jgi:hypothetical protein